MTDLEMDLPTVQEFIKSQPNSSKIYIGCDSSTYKKGGVWWADYITVVVIHMSCPQIPGRMVGGKIFGRLERERDYTVDKGKPNLRLLTEVQKASILFTELSEAIGRRQVEIHLDINQDPAHASQAVAQQAIGYIRGVCGLEPKIKPEAFAASYCADRFMRVKNFDITKPDTIKKHVRPRKTKKKVRA